MVACTRSWSPPTTTTFLVPWTGCSRNTTTTTFLVTLDRLLEEYAEGAENAEYGEREEDAAEHAEYGEREDAEDDMSKVTED